eukprot:TRINITY_DN6823_c0_g1_i1.p1 TRINITY_DN6823_c0_g1~~TRINITY_DN6823_c0_g1_i1.p1  ORF type:complete len:1316 (+),score=310.29 TRINITY_DN6823_c0_g1_i1:1-3948(+)
MTGGETFISNTLFWNNNRPIIQQGGSLIMEGINVTSNNYELNSIDCNVISQNNLFKKPAQAVINVIGGSFQSINDTFDGYTRCTSGQIALVGAESHIYESIFMNMISDQSCLLGILIYATNGSIIIENCLFERNNIILLALYSDAMTRNNTFKDNYLDANYLGIVLFSPLIFVISQYDSINDTFYNNNYTSAVVASLGETRLFGAKFISTYGNSFLVVPYSGYTNVDVINCSFYNSSGSDIIISSSLVQAIGAVRISLNIEGSTFYGTKSSSLQLNDPNLDQLTVRDCEFYGSGNDRALTVDFPIRQLHLINSSFTGFSKPGNGGTISIGSFCSISESFIMDRVQISNSQSNTNGGCLFFSPQIEEGANVTFRDIEFTKCSSFRSGGAVYLFPSFIGAGRDLTISGLNVTQSDATIGGGVYIGGNGISQIVILDSIFDGNDANLVGGGISLDLVVESVFLKGVKFTNNFGAFQGGGMVTFNSFSASRIVIEDCQFKMNVGKSGSGMSLVGSITGSINVSQSLFQLNSEGPAFQIDSTTEADVIISQTQFVENVSPFEGGGIQLFQRLRNVIIRDTSFIRNSAQSGGGMSISSKLNSITIENVISSGNIALEQGGFAELSFEAVDGITLRNIQSDSDSASSGGSIYFQLQEDSMTMMSNISFSKCLSVDGQLYLRGSNSTMDIHGSKWNENSGPNLYVEGSFGVLRLSQVRASNNVAQLSGAFRLSASIDNMIVESSQFEGNMIKEGTFAQEGKIKEILVTNNQFNRNTATKSGGGFAFKGSQEIIKFTNNSWSFNSANEDGGSIYFSNTTQMKSFISQDEKFYQNTAANGGAMSIEMRSSVRKRQSKANFTISRATVDNNSAVFGGGLFVSSDTVVMVQDSKFTENSGQVSGGGIATHSMVVVGSSTFISSISERGSTASILSNGNLQMTKNNVQQKYSVLLDPFSSSSLVTAENNLEGRDLVSCGTNGEIQIKSDSSFGCKAISPSNNNDSINRDGDNSTISIYIIIGVIVAVVVIAVVVSLIVVFVMLKKREMRRRRHNQSIDMSDIDLTAAKKAIVNFDEISNMKPIGNGAFGVVFKGHWRELEIAVKQIKSEHVTKEQVEEFLSESTLLQNLRKHPNIVMFIGITVPPQPLSLVTEYCGGGGLYQYLRIHDVTDGQKMAFIIGIAKGMLHLHCEGIVHRDLAVRNILLSGSNEPKVSDFGLSRKQESADASVTVSLIGPLKYMSPEAIQKKEYSRKSDVFSFGVVIWEIVTVEDPWANKSMIDAAIGVTRGDRLVIPLNTQPILTSIMKKCWENLPEDRPTFENILNELQS